MLSWSEFGSSCTLDSYLTNILVSPACCTKINRWYKWRYIFSCQELCSLSGLTERNDGRKLHSHCIIYHEVQYTPWSFWRNMLNCHLITTFHLFYFFKKSLNCYSTYIKYLYRVKFTCWCLQTCDVLYSNTAIWNLFSEKDWNIVPCTFKMLKRKTVIFQAKVDVF